MTTNFPGSLDTTAVLENDKADSSERAGNLADFQNNAADAILALQAKVGATTSAVPTSLDYLVKRFNVVARGAVGDGVTDDTAVIQAVIDDAASVGGWVYFPRSATPYYCSTLTWKTGVYGVGDGMTASGIKLKSGTGDDLIKGNGFAALTGGDTAAGIHDWGFRDLYLDGNKANNAATSWVVRYYGYRPFFENVDIRNGKSGGMYSQGFTPSDPIATLNRGGGFRNTHFHDNDGDGLYFNGVADTTFSDCWFFYNTDSGVQIATRGAGARFVSCHFYGNDLDYCARVQASGVKFTGCVFEGQTVAGIYLESGGTICQIIGNYFFAAGTQAAKVGVKVNGTSAYQIIGNYFIGLTDGAVLFTSDSGAGMIRNNYIFASSGTAFAGTAATSTTIADNQLVGGTGADPGTAITVASGVATVPNGCDFALVSGEGAASDDLTNVIPMRRAGDRVYLYAVQQLTLKHYAGGATGKILTPGAADFVLTLGSAAQLISKDPHWVVVMG